MRKWVLTLVLACGHVATGPGDGARVGVGGGSGVGDGGGVGVGDGGGGGAPSTSRLVITNLGPGRFEVSNVSASAERLKTNASIERKDEAGAWQPIDARFDLGKGYRLLERCEPTPPDCVDLASGATLTPVPWSGFNCSAQCNGTCRANSFEGPGTFRLVVSTCAGARSVGRPFDLPDINGANITRFALTTDVTSATVLRLEVPSQAGFDASSAPALNRVAGFAVAAGSEHPLDRAAQDELVALLRAPKGFDDQIVKRCAVRTLVGVRLTRTLETTGVTPRTAVAEVALDFTCQKLFSVEGDAGHRVVGASHFDPSRPAFIQWVKHALPADPEIMKLR